ncbi:MAG TPA: glycosyl hydrolase, partial [Metabacillus sp.]|nr:glycosyl hydrolase [Metabacillus sp.]
MENLSWVDKAWGKVNAKVERMSKKIGANFPHASVNGSYQLEAPSWWTAGFWPGLLWLVYRETKEESLKELAEQCEVKLDRVITDYYK